MLTPGSRIGPYEIVALIGAGGMGEVYRAHDTRLDRDVAVKVLADGLLQDGSSIARFQREARLAGSLDHPNVLAVHDVGEHRGKPYLVVELLDGQSLRERLKAGPISQGKALGLALQIAQGLVAAHDKGIVHRDLKPENVFLTREERVKILDFGIAKLLPPVPEGTAPIIRTSTGAVIGTPAYMSPEQIRGGAADARSDFFSFGCLIYEMLAGDRPFTGQSEMDLGAAILHDEPAALPADIPQRLAKLVAHCLEKAPEHRFQSARDLVFDLQQVATETTGEPSREPPRKAASRSTDRSPLKRSLVVAAGLCAIGALVWVVVARSHLPASKSFAAAPSIAVLPFADLSPQKDQDYFSDGLAEELLNALAHVDGLHVAGRTSSFSFKGRNEDMRSVGQKLNVAHLLEGSVRKAGSRVRITAQLISAADGFHLWSQTYDRELTDIFSVQDEIARSVVEALRLKLLPGRQATSERYRTANPEVYRLYLVGRQILDRYPSANVAAAVRDFREALAIEPGYAPAWAALATALIFLAEDTVNDAFRETYREALDAADKAIALDPQLAEGYVARANLRAALNWDWTGSLADLGQARALQPLQAEALVREAQILAALGRMPDALASARKAVDLDPISFTAGHALVWLQMATGDLAEARRRAENLLEVVPGNGYVLFALAEIDLLQARPADALARFADRPPDFWAWLARAMAHHDLGQRAEAQQALDHVRAHTDPTAAFQEAWVYSWWGQPDEAFESLERAWRKHDTGLYQLKYVPFLKKLHGDQRFAALLKKLNLPPD